MEDWRLTWRNGIAPLLPTAGLVALRAALLTGDERLLQGANTSPPPLAACRDWPVEGACAVGYAFWKGGLATVAEVQEAFTRACSECDRLVGETAGCRWFLNYFDETPIERVRDEVVPEIDRELARREVPS